MEYKTYSYLNSRSFEEIQALFIPRFHGESLKEIKMTLTVIT